MEQEKTQSIFCDSCVLIGMDKGRHLESLTRISKEYQLVTSLNIGEFFKISEDSLSKGREHIKTGRRLRKMLRELDIRIVYPLCFVDKIAVYDGNGLPHFCLPECWKQDPLDACYRAVKTILRTELIESPREKDKKEFIQYTLEQLPYYSELTKYPLAELAMRRHLELLFHCVGYNRDALTPKKWRNNLLDLEGAQMLGYVDFAVMDKKMSNALIDLCRQKKIRDFGKTEIVCYDDGLNSLLSALGSRKRKVS